MLRDGEGVCRRRLLTLSSVPVAAGTRTGRPDEAKSATYCLDGDSTTSQLRSLATEISFSHFLCLLLCVVVVVSTLVKFVCRSSSSSKEPGSKRHPIFIPSSIIYEKSNVGILLKITHITRLLPCADMLFSSVGPPRCRTKGNISCCLTVNCLPLVSTDVKPVGVS